MAEATGDIASEIQIQNDNVARAFGLNEGIDIITTIPTDLNDEVASNDNEGQFGLVLASVSQMSENSHDMSPEDTIKALVEDMNGADGSHIDTIEGRPTANETVDMLTAIDNFETSGGDSNLDNGAGSTHTGEAGSAKGEGSVTGNLSIIKISLYDGTNSEPTLQDYTNAGINGVTNSNLTLVNAQLAAATDKDTMAEIQALVNTTSGVATTTHSTLTASPTNVPADGLLSSTITLQAKDYIGDDLTTGGLTVVMTSTGSATLSSAVDNNDGTYSATITNTTAEIVTVSATIDGNFVADTATVTFTTGVASAANSTLSASPTSVSADGSTSSTITMQVKDINGNNLTTGGLSVSMNSTGSATLSSVIDNNDSTYSATITNTTAEIVTVSATLNGNNVTDTATVTFTNTVSDAHSTLSANPSSVPADGSTTATITMQAKDAYGYKLTTGGLNVSMTSTGSAVLSSVTDHNDGTYTATMTNTVIENVTVSATIGGNNVADTATVTFTSPPMLAYGLTYSAVIIGTQTWTAENMRHLTPNSIFRAVSYDNDVNKDADGYGKLYAWHTAMNGSTTEGTQGICSAGWHIPSDNDWKILEGYLGMSKAEQDLEGIRGTDQGAQLKAGGGSGFEGVLAGFYNTNLGGVSSTQNNFKDRGLSARFWSSTIKPDAGLNPLGFLGSETYVRSLSTGDAKAKRSVYSRNNNTIKFSVRCLKD